MAADMMTSQELAALALEDAMLAGAESSTSEEDFRPSIADQQKVGFFSQDRASQTEVSEIVSLKEMTEVLNALIADAKTLKRELALAKQVMQADYENRLQEKALDLYCRVNDRIDEIEKMHDDRVGVVRRSFKQQLADALVKLNNDWKKHYGMKMNEEKKKDAGKKDIIAEEIKELQAQIQQQDSVIHLLKMQLQQYTGQAQDDASSTRSPSVNPEIQELKTEIDKLHNKINNLEDALDTKDETTDQLNKEIDQLNKELEKERVTIQQLLVEKDELVSRAEQDKASIKRQLEKQKLETEREMQDKLSKARDEVLNMAKRQAEDLQKQEEEKNKLLSEQKKATEALLAKEREEALKENKSDEDLARLKKLEKLLKQENVKLKRELDRTHKTWEKKFAILQQSLHAIKDESYLRQTLQKQAATLAHASVTYSADAPVGIMPTNGQLMPSGPPANSRSTRKQTQQPLPAIGKVQQQARDILTAYTVTPPPGRAIATFSAGESQIVDPNEEIDMDGILPLPSPPPSAKGRVRIRGDFLEERPNSGHIIVLPSA
ncbi:uncharacterized protein C10orf67, mitochondrial-like isoform X2 [Ptychodera flava]|uniref:uncharacterized protein C10orf67, mitochondrial-like isoform X2 n=1 Tax=Ptychodera flava TaxID=63121 RepID=UPI00396A6EEF